VRIFRTLAVGIFLFLTVSISFSQPRPMRYFTDYLYLTNQEMTLRNEIIWFWTPDTLYGNVHSNSMIGIRNAPRFYGQVSSTASRFIEGPRQAYFAYDPQFNVPHVYIGFTDLEQYYNERAHELGTYLTSEDPRLQGRLTGIQAGWLLERWRHATPYSPQFLEDIQIIGYSDEDWNVIYFDGALEISGEGIRGKTAITATENIRLLDNVMVADVDTSTWLIPEESENSINIYGQSRIIVANTRANGRGNGASTGEWEDHSNKHIVITASMQTEGESFLIEDQNDTWDHYIFCACPGEHCGEADERGSIFLHGSLTQYRRGYVHRSNCSGTGYATNYTYDERLYGVGPAGIGDLRWDNPQAVWEDTTIIFERYGQGPGFHTWTELTIGPGTTLIFRDGLRLDVQYLAGFQINGEEDRPVRIIIEDEEDIAPFTAYPEWWRYPVNYDFITDDQWDYVEIEMNSGELFTPSILRNSKIISNGRVEWVMKEQDTRAAIENCQLEGQFQLELEDDNQRLNILRTSVIGRMRVENEVRLDHVVFLAGEDDDHETALYCPRPATVRNSFFLGEYRTVFSGHPDEHYASYCGTFGSTAREPWGYFVERGEGIFIADPLFVNPDSGDFHLRSNSPLIDSGDLESPNDPDGSRADVGVFPYDPEYWRVGEENTKPELPHSFDVSGPYPNPFNSIARFRVEVPANENLSVDIFNLEGRIVRSVSPQNHGAGTNEITVDLKEFATGIYLIKFSTENHTRIVKAVLIK